MITKIIFKANILYWLNTNKNQMKWNLYLLLHGGLLPFIYLCYSSCYTSVGFQSLHGRKKSFTSTCTYKYSQVHTLILLKFLKLILISVDEMLPGYQLVPFNHYASHKFISGKVTSLKLSKVPKP